MTDYEVEINYDSGKKLVDVNPYRLEIENEESGRVSPIDTVTWRNASTEDVKLLAKKGDWNPPQWVGAQLGPNPTKAAPTSAKPFESKLKVLDIYNGVPSKYHGKQKGRELRAFHYTVVVNGVVFDPTVIIIDP